MVWCNALRRGGWGMARRIETEFREAISGDFSEGRVENEPQALIDVALRKRAEAEGDRLPPSTTRRRKRAAKPLRESTHADAPTPGGSALDGVPSGPAGGWFASTGVQPWSAGAIVAVAAFIVLSMMSWGDLPKPLPVANVTISWLPGPRVPDAEVLAWLRRCPQYEKLSAPNEWVLQKLADHLRALPAVAEVRQVRLFHEPGKVSAIRRVTGKPPVLVQLNGIRRTVEVQLGLRQPYLPAILKDGSRAWIDAAGVVLPGVLPNPGVQRPLVRGLEGGGRPAIAEAVELWRQLEPQIEKGLITDIVLNDALDPLSPAPAVAGGQALAGGQAVAGGQPAPPVQIPAGTPRGLVLYTRQGAKFIWGAPGEERFGVQSEDKVRDLVHTIKCQGDLSRIERINVRFKEPFYLLR